MVAHAHGGGLSVPPPAANSSLEQFRPRQVKLGGGFTLTDYNGARLSLRQLRGDVVLIAFGFTHCPDVCPATALKMSNVLKRLGARAGPVRTLFITVDPERDTPARLKNFLSFFHPDIIGLTGTLEEVEDVGNLFAATFRKVDKGSAAGYLVSHSSFYYLLDTEGRVRYVLPHATTPTMLLKGISSLQR